MTLLAMSLTAAACGPRTRETDLQRAVKAHDVDAKPGTEESKARKKIESFIGSIIAPGTTRKTPRVSSGSRERTWWTIPSARPR